MFLDKLRLYAILTAITALAPAREFDAGQFQPTAPRPPIVLPVQTKNLKELSAGKLLVASRDLADPNFAHTVVLLIHYNADGVAGLVLNRRTDLPLSQVMEGVKGAKDRSDRVYLGGPVERPSLYCLLHARNKPEGAEHIFGGTYLISTKPLFDQIMSTRPDPGNIHVYLGYAGWAKEQLRMEVAEGAWFIFPADVETVFSADPDSLWPEMIRKTELKVARGNADRNRLGKGTASAVP